MEVKKAGIFNLTGFNESSYRNKNIISDLIIKSMHFFGRLLFALFFLVVINATKFDKELSIDKESLKIDNSAFLEEMKEYQTDFFNVDKILEPFRGSDFKEKKAEGFISEEGNGQKFERVK